MTHTLESLKELAGKASDPFLVSDEEYQTMFNTRVVQALLACAEALKFCADKTIVWESVGPTGATTMNVADPVAALKALSRLEAAGVKL